MNDSAEFVAVELVRPSARPWFACSHTGPRRGASALAESMSDDDALIPHRVPTGATAKAVANSSSSFAMLAAAEAGASPIDTPAQSRTAASTPEELAAAFFAPATAAQRPLSAAISHHRTRVAPPAKLTALLEPGSLAPASNPQSPLLVVEGASPTQPPTRPLSAAQLKKTAPLVKCPKASPWATPAGFATLAKYLGRGIDSGDFFLRLTDDGAGGTYFVYARHDTAGAAPIAVFKPGTEEVGAPENPRGNDSTDDDARFEVFAAGDGYLREAIAYELDHGHFAGVPQTLVAEVNGAVGSLQRFVPRMMQSWSTTPAKFDTAAVHAIAVFDVRTLNCDRHGGNLLVRRDAPAMGMVPIDHGFILPEAWCDPDFEWSLWPQANAPVSDATRQYVATLDADRDAALVRERLGEGPAEVIGVTTRLLQCALAPGKSYTMRDIAAFCRRPSLAEPSGLEQVMTHCRRDLDDGGDIDFAAVEGALRQHFP